MEIKITTLTENSATFGHIAEWGLSMLVEADGARVLFDTGAGFTAVYNAQLNNIDLQDINRIVLSHGHHDHTGGLEEVLIRVDKAVEVIAHPDIFAAKYSKFSRHPEHFIGLPFRRELLENFGARFRLTSDPVRITEHISTIGEVPMVTTYEIIEHSFFVKEGGKLKPDPLADDLGMVIDTDFGLVVILGCAHRGMINTLKQAQKITGKKKIYAAIGGTHLVNSNLERWAMTAADLKEMGVRYLGVSHCTGFEASAYLAQEFGKNFFLNNSGSKWTLPFKE
jgi:7,8-dihydropterin-6-yl-methyl-4-(beta-D-ribofuranosyl)aminobenzene 5'-phosphate synthase